MAARPTPINPNNEPFRPRNGDGPELHEPLIDWHATWRYLLHGDFFDNLVLLPTVLLQKGNPATETVTTSTQVRVTTNFFVFNSEKRPLAKVSELTVVSGPNAGSKATSQTFYSYY